MCNILKHADTIPSLKMKQSYLHVWFHRLPQKLGTRQPGTGFVQDFPIASVSHRPSPEQLHAFALEMTVLINVL